ncbi:MAG: hypothetical protein QG657_1716 [Acidobacteriota bacterium]|nr:hypothetical protein [Acidobacteriota bacterium]
MAQPNIKPIFLLADSQLLFWRGKETPLMERIRKLMEQDKPEGPFKAAYIGASNGDKPEFYDIFLAAVSQVGIPSEDCRLIPSKKTNPKDLKFLEEADFILLAGGSIEKGWNIIKEKFQQRIVDRYYKGAVLMGISAGAVQLGLKGWKEGKRPVEGLFETFQIVPAVIDVHNEESDWHDLATMVDYLGSFNRGFGIPYGGGAVYHPDWSFEAIRHHLVEFAFVKLEDNNVTFKRSLIIPGEPTGPTEPPPTPSPEALEALTASEQPGIYRPTSPVNMPPESVVIDTEPVAPSPVKTGKKESKKTNKTKKTSKAKKK